MHKLKKETKRLLYPYEVLRARFDIRDFFLKTIVRQVYENSGQALSLVKMQLDEENSSVFQNQSNETSPGKLLEQTIKDLRYMCKNFYPDKDMLTDGGFADLLQLAAAKVFQNNKAEFVLNEADIELPEGIQLITLKIILDILISIHEVKGQLQKTQITYTDGHIGFIISYLSKEAVLFKKNQRQNYPYLSFYERVELINASIDQRTPKTGYHQFILQLSKNSFKYEQEYQNRPC